MSQASKALSQERAGLKREKCGVLHGCSRDAPVTEIGNAKSASILPKRRRLEVDY